MSKKYTVFTYGSLMKDFYGYKLFMKEADFLGEAKVNGDLRFFCSDYPVMIKKRSGNTSVKGELYQVDEDVMDKLRNYEGIGNPFTCYTEKVVKAETTNGVVPARAFVVIPSIEVPMKLTSRHIPEGDWRLFKTSSKKLPLPQPLMFSFAIFMIGAAIWQMGHM